MLLLSSNRISDYFRQIKAPIGAHMDFTYRCNLKCIHCFQDKRKLAELSIQKINDIFIQLKKAGCLMAVFSGGEPFLRKDFLKTLALADAKGFVITIKSNGTLLDKKRVEFLKKLRLKEMHISLYGITDKVHDFTTAVKGSFEKTIHGIRLLREEGIKVKAPYLLMKHNFFQLKGLRQFSRKHNIEEQVNYLVYPTSGGKPYPLRYRITNEQIYDIMRIAALRNSIISPRLLRKNRRSEFSNYVYIAPDGQVYPCTSLRWPCGNLQEKFFRDIWENSLVLRKLRNLKCEDFECYECKNFQNCKCYEPSLAYLEHGDFKKSPQEVCRFMGIGLESPVLTDSLKKKEE